MKNVIKKIAATAMAFAMLGTGTAITKTIAPQFDTAITANAASYCNHVVGSASYGEETCETEFWHWYSNDCTKTYRQDVRCIKCGKKLWTNCRSEDWIVTTHYYMYGSYTTTDIINVKHWTEY